MKKILVLFVISIVNFGFAQNQLDTIIQNLDKIKTEFNIRVQIFKDSLRENQTTLYFTYEENAVGYAKPFTLEQYQKKPCSCIEEKGIYFFWQDKNQTLGKKIDYCGNSKTFRFGKSEIWNLYLQDRNGFEKEKVKPFQYKHGNELNSLWVDHGVTRELNLFDGEKIIEKVFRNLNFFKQDSGVTNVNFEYNNKLKSKKVIDILSAFTEELDN